MAHEKIKNDDIIQLKQMIIFLKAELIKYETMDNVSEMNRLKEENRQLISEKEALQKEVKNAVKPLQEPSQSFKQIDEKLAYLLEIVQKNKTAQQNINELLQKITEKESIIYQYEKEVTKLTKANEKMAKEIQKISPELVRQMDEQMKAVIRKSLEYTKQVEEKLKGIEEIEQKVNQMMAAKNEEK